MHQHWCRSVFAAKQNHDDGQRRRFFARLQQRHVALDGAGQRDAGDRRRAPRRRRRAVVRRRQRGRQFGGAHAARRHIRVAAAARRHRGWAGQSNAAAQVARLIALPGRGPTCALAQRYRPIPSFVLSDATILVAITW